MLNPDLAEAHTTLAYALAIYDWDWQASEREFRRAIELDPTFPLTLMHASWLYWVRGDTAHFFAARERLDAVSERGGVSASVLRQAYAVGGPDSVLRLQVGAPGARRETVGRAKWHVLLGDLDAAFLDLEQAERERSVWLPIGTSYPYMGPLRADPRYAALRERMGLP